MMVKNLRDNRTTLTQPFFSFNNNNSITNTSKNQPLSKGEEKISFLTSYGGVAFFWSEGGYTHEHFN